MTRWGPRSGVVLRRSLAMYVGAVTFPLLCFIIQPSSAQGGCRSDEFACGEGECIDEDDVCDRLVHCSNGRDEEDCPGEDGASADNAVAIVADIFGICLGIFCICSCCSIVVLYKYCCNSPRRPAYQPTRHPRRAPRRTSSVNTTVVAARLPDSGQTYATPGCHDQQYSYNNDGSQFYSGVNPAPPDYHNSTSFPPIQRALPIPAPPMAPHISQSRPWVERTISEPSAPPHPTPSEAPPPYTLPSAPPLPGGHTPNDVIVPLQTFPSNQDDPPPYSAPPIDSTVM